MRKVEIGSKFHRLTVLELVPGRKNAKALCVCDCGTQVTPQHGALLNGRAKSCGCLRLEILRAIGTKHGMSKGPEYQVYLNILERCNNPNAKEYHNYGGRGIKATYDSFEQFYLDVGRRPQGAWIDRIHNDQGYAPGNCRWVTPSVNQKNKRVSRFWTINGNEYDSAPDAARALGVSTSVVIRGCNGYVRRGRSYPPRDGWSSRLKYPQDVPVPDLRSFDA